MSEWDQRQLCPDGACVGVIGSDGTCRTCGRAAPNWGDERNRGLLRPEGDAELSTADDEAPGDKPEAADTANSTPQTASPDWEDRKLCPDDACIGVVGESGACNVCGRRAA